MHEDRHQVETEHAAEAHKILDPIAVAAGLEASCIHEHFGIAAPTEAITACVDGHHADLLVMGSVGRGGFTGLLMGNTAERLLGRVDCSVLVVKPDGFTCPVGIT